MPIGAPSTGDGTTSGGPRGPLVAGGIAIAGLGGLAAVAAAHRRRAGAGD